MKRFVDMVRGVAGSARRGLWGPGTGTSRLESAPLPSGAAADARSPQGAAREQEPLVSLILTVKNGLPYLEEALDSVRRQTYRRFEVVAQDCLSTDGSSEMLESFQGDWDMHVRREADGGLGDANNKALARCSGSLIASIDCDNLLEPDALERMVQHFAAHPGDAVLYSSVKLIDADGQLESLWRPGPFDLMRVLNCDSVLPWSTTVLNRDLCGDALGFDPSLKTCQDYDAWLRLSHLPIAFMDLPLGSYRSGAQSGTCDPDLYEQLCKDKLSAMERYVAQCDHAPLRAALRAQAAVGIYCWAAESVRLLANDRVDLIVGYFERAKAINPSSPRLAQCEINLFQSTPLGGPPRSV